jgi:hypothetical protein
MKGCSLGNIHSFSVVDYQRMYGISSAVEARDAAGTKTSLTLERDHRFYGTAYSIGNVRNFNHVRHIEIL